MLHMHGEAIVGVGGAAYAVVGLEFERNKGIRDVTQIRYLISTGKTQWESMDRYINGL